MKGLLEILVVVGILPGAMLAMHLWIRSRTTKRENYIAAFGTIGAHTTSVFTP